MSETPTLDGLIQQAEVEIEKNRIILETVGEMEVEQNRRKAAFEASHGAPIERREQ